MILRTRFGILGFNTATAAEGAVPYTANKDINNNNDLEKKKLENEDYLNRMRLTGEQEE